MCSIGETCDAHLFSRLLAEKGNLIQSNKTVKNLTFKKYDETLEKMVYISDYFKGTNISNEDKNTFIEKAIIQNMTNKEIENRRLETYQ